MAWQFYTKDGELKTSAAGGSGGASQIDDLAEISSAAQGDIIIRDGTDWDNVNIGTNEIVGRAVGDVDGIAVAEQTLVGRITAGNLTALSAAQARTLLNVEDGADVTDATNVATAGAVMDSDINESEGFMRKTGAGAYEAIKSNLSAGTAPTVDDDSGDGYAVGSRWIDTTNDKEYVCLDASQGAAVWTETTQSGGGGASVPAGVLAPYGGSSAPSGWLLCDGSAVSRTTYADLFTAIGETFGVGDGSTTFNLPDMRGRIPLGKDNMGGTSANRVTNAQADTVGGSAGAEEHTLTIAEMPAHTHGLGEVGKANGGNTASKGSGSASTTSSTGGGGAHNNMPPYLTLNYIIKT